MLCYNWCYMVSFKACCICFPEQELKKKQNTQNPKNQMNKKPQQKKSLIENLAFETLHRITFQIFLIYIQDYM